MSQDGRHRASQTVGRVQEQIRSLQFAGITRLVCSDRELRFASYWQAVAPAATFLRVFFGGQCREDSLLSLSIEYLWPKDGDGIFLRF
jgi:hypothetical protein